MEHDSLSEELPVDSCERDLHETAQLWWQPYIYFKHEVETSSFSILSVPIIFGTKTPAGNEILILKSTFIFDK